MGFPVSASRSYLYQTPSGYIFRLTVPRDLRPLVGQGEFRYSLRAGALRVAKHRARCIASFIHEQFYRARAGMTEITPKKMTQMVKEHVQEVVGSEMESIGVAAEVVPGSIVIDGKTVLQSSYAHGSNGKVVLPPERIKELTLRYIRETLDNDEKCRAMAGSVLVGSTTLEGMTFLESSNMKADEARAISQSVSRWLRQADHSLMNSLTEKLLQQEGVEVDPESETYRTLSRELLKAFQSILQVRIRRAKGDYSVPDQEIIPQLKEAVQVPQFAQVVQPVAVPSETSEPPAMKFTEVQEVYVAEVEKGESWTEKTKSENLSIFALFVQAMGDLAVDKIDRKLMVNFKSIIMKLPPNLNKGSKYKDKSIEDIIASNPEKTLTVNTINKYLRRLSGLFNFAVKNGFMLTNPAEGLQIRSQRRADQERDAYTREDLEKLFGSDEYRDGKHRNSYMFWAPLIALYTGCRLEEICQLHLDDIRQEDGVWIIDINNKAEKRVKTMSSQRLIPIHPKLIEAGLLRHVESLTERGEKRLFPELRQRRDGYGQTVSKWFQRYKERCGIEEGKTFHSFRHTFITHLKHKQVDPFMIHELDGHAIDSQTMGRYGKRYTPQILLREAIGKIEYDFH